MKRGLFIGRFQPFHNGHHTAIRKMGQELQELIIGIGSAQYSNYLTNPFTAEERELMIRRSLDGFPIPYQVVHIPDIHDFPRWVDHVTSLTPDFDVIYSGNTIVKELFLKKDVEVRAPYKDETAIPGTEVRMQMVRGDNWQSYVPNGSLETLLEIKGENRLREIYGKHLRPSVTVDVIADFGNEGILYIKRGNQPFKGQWALPGGHHEPGEETVEEGASRELYEETGLVVKPDDLNLIGVYSNPGRDVRNPTVSLLYGLELNGYEGSLKPGDDAVEAQIIYPMPDKLAFDHKTMINDWLRRKNEFR